MNRRVWVVGASRGIGLELVCQYIADGAPVSATARRPADVEALRALGADAWVLDLQDAAAIAAEAPRRLNGAGFGTVLVVAGVYGPSTHGLEAPSPDDFDTVMRTNVAGPMRLLPLLAEAGVLAPGARLGVLSSRMGSIGERASPGGWLYRASKAALNSVLKDTSLVLTGRATCVALHPGWVRTDMGGANADLTVQQSAADLRATLARLAPADNGGFFNHDGTPIAW